MSERENLKDLLKLALKDLEDGRPTLNVAQGLRNMLNLYWRKDDSRS